MAEEIGIVSFEQQMIQNLKITIHPFILSEYPEVIYEMINLKQTTTVENYYEEFTGFLNCLQPTEEDALQIFINNLKSDITKSVKFFYPKTLTHALKLANLVESLFYNQPRNYFSPDEYSNITLTMKTPILPPPKQSPSILPNSSMATNANPSSMSPSSTSIKLIFDFLLTNKNDPVVVDASNDLIKSQVKSNGSNNFQSKGVSFLLQEPSSSEDETTESLKFNSKECLGFDWYDLLGEHQVFMKFERKLRDLKWRQCIVERRYRFGSKEYPNTTKNWDPYGFRLLVMERGIALWAAIIGVFTWHRSYEECIWVFLKVNDEYEMRFNSETFISLDFTYAGAEFQNVTGLGYGDYNDRLSKGPIHIYSISIDNIMYPVAFLILLTANESFNSSNVDMVFGSQLGIVYVTFGNLKNALVVFDKLGRSVYDVGVKRVFENELSLVKTSSKFYTKAGFVKVNLFRRKKEKYITSWSSMIDCYCHYGVAVEALHLLNKIINKGYQSNAVSVLQVFPKLKLLKHVKDKHGYILKQGLEYNNFVGAVVIEMSVHCELCSGVGVKKFIFPSGDQWLFRLLLGWLMPLQGYWFKVISGEVIRNYYRVKHVNQDMLALSYKVRNILMWVYHEMEDYVEIVVLTYCDDKRKRLSGEMVNKVLALLNISAGIMFDAGTNSCLEYVAAAPWYEAKVKNVLSHFHKLESHGSMTEALQRVSFESSTFERTNDLFLKLLSDVIQAKVMDVNKGGVGTLMVEIAREGDYLQWIIVILIDKRIANNFVKFRGRSEETCRTSFKDFHYTILEDKDLCKEGVFDTCQFFTSLFYA